MSAWKNISPTAAKYTIRSLVAPKRVTFKETQPLAIFLGGDNKASYTGSTWEEIIRQLNQDIYATATSTTKVHKE